MVHSPFTSAQASKGRAMIPKIVIIDSACIAAGYTAEAVKSLGFEPVFLCTLAQFQGDARRQIGSYRHIDCDTTSVAAVIEAIRTNGLAPLKGILTTEDTRLTVACAVARELGVPGIDPAVLQLKDKAAVAALIPEFSPRSVSFASDSIPGAAIRALFVDGGKVIVKPTQGAGALGVFCLSSSAEVETLAWKIGAAALPAYIDDGGWIAQSFIEGRLVSAEGYVIDGTVTVVGFTGRRKIGSTESAAMYPVDESLPAPVSAKAKVAIAALIERSNFRFGYFHIEFMVTATDCSIIDANMGRIGGGPVGQLLALSSGKDPVDVYRHLIQVTLFGETLNGSPFYTTRDRRETYGVLYGLAGGGVISDVHLPEGMPCYHTQIFDSGAYVHPMGKDDWTWVGILTGFTRDTLRVIEEIRICTPEGQFPACF